MTPETVRALENLIEREGVSLTEALRRLVGYGDFLYRVTKEDASTVLVRNDDSVREVVIF